MANVIDIVIKATDQTGGTINKLDSAFKSITGVSLSAAGGIALAGKAVDTLYKFMRDSVMETEKYVTSITDMSRVLGLSTEETSRLVQASDDLFISQDKLYTSMLAASRKGIDVTTEGLKNLSEQYLKLNPGVDRAQFLMQTFGRSGSDMGKLMEVGADGIDAATAAIKDNLIVTAQSKINIENYKRSVDNLKDSWQGFKYTVGNEVIPQLDLLMRVLTKGKDEVEIHEQAVNALELRMSKLAGAAAFGNKAAKAALEELQKEYDSLIALTPKTTQSIDDISDSTDKASDYFRELTTEMLYNYAAAGLDRDAAFDLARKMGLLNEATYAAIVAQKAWKTQLDLNYISASQYNSLIASLSTNLSGVSAIGSMALLSGAAPTALELAGGTSKPNTSGVGNWTGVIDSATGKKQYLDADGSFSYHASGGSASGWSIVGEQGPELVKLPGGSNIVPNNQLNGTASISQSDMVYLGKIIATEIQKAIG